MAERAWYPRSPKTSIRVRVRVRVRIRVRVRVRPLISEDLHHQVGRAVQDEVLLCEILLGVDDAEELDHLFDAVEVATEPIRDGRDEIEAAPPRRLDAFVERKPARPERASDHGAVELDWQVAGHVEERRALEACGLVVGLRASGRRQGDAELGEAALDVHGPHECRAARTDRGQQRGGERPRGQERSGAAQHKPRPAYRRSASATRARRLPAQLTLRQAELRRTTGAYRVHGPIPAASARKSRR